MGVTKKAGASEREDRCPKEDRERGGRGEEGTGRNGPGRMLGDVEVSGNSVREGGLE